MTEFASFDYTEEELRSYLPSGWTLVEHDQGEVDASWNPKKRTWSTRVEDTADVRWELSVRQEEVDKEGRIAALKKAMDRLYLDRLGRRTRGLGI